MLAYNLYKIGCKNSIAGLKTGKLGLFVIMV
jgi:hypothetical protein